jgi:hypothetical protein
MPDELQNQPYDDDGGERGLARGSKDEQDDD